MHTDNKVVGIGSEGNNFHLIEINRLQEFKGHAFKPYTGEKLEQMAQSIRDNGIIHPIIVRQLADSDNFEIVSGHNRTRAAQIAGILTIPAVVRTLTDDEAIILANEANITQRTFKSWLPSEKANSILQYHAAIKRQGERNDLTSGGKHQKSENAREKTACAYGLKANTIRLYLELCRLIDGLKERLDNEEFGNTSAQNLSYISKQGQALINSVLDEDKSGEKYMITVTNSKVVRKELEDYTSDDLRGDNKNAIRAKIKEMLNQEIDSLESEKARHVTIMLPKTQYNYLFGDAAREDVVEEIIAAVEYYRNAKVDEL